MTSRRIRNVKIGFYDIVKSTTLESNKSHPLSTAAPVCPAGRPSRVPAPVTAGPQPLHSPAGPRQTRPVCAPVHARRRAFHALFPVAAHQSPGSRRPRPFTRPPTEAGLAGGQPASVGSGAGSAQWHRPTSEFGTCRLTPLGAVPRTNDGQSGDGPANTRRPSPAPTRASPEPFQRFCRKVRFLGKIQKL